MGLANDPCWASARPEELRFVLLGRDPDAPEVVRDWVRRRLARVTGVPIYRQLTAAVLRSRLLAVDGLDIDDRAWMIEALDCADAMDAQRNVVRAALGKAV